jgi:hypothetical protein
VVFPELARLSGWRWQYAGAGRGRAFITVVWASLIALLIDQPVKGQGVLRILVIAPFFVMPPVAASIWENLFMHPQNGLFAALARRRLGRSRILFLENHPMLSVIGIVSWEWLPFATLILLTALQSLSRTAGGRRDGRRPAFSRFRYIILPHLTRAITVVILIQTIFLLWASSARSSPPPTAGRDRHRPPCPTDLQAGHRRQGHRGGGGGGRHHRGHPGQHRRLFPDARHRQESGDLRNGPHQLPPRKT